MRRTLFGGTVLLAAVLLAGCSGSSSGGGDAAKGAADLPQAQQRDAGLAGSTAGGEVQRTSIKATLLETGTKIRIAELTVDVKRGGVASAANRAEAIAASVGGDVDSDDRTSGRNATAALVLRVPPTSLMSVLDQLSGLGREVSRQLSTTDVTQKVADVDSRVRSAQGSITRLQKLYDDAKKVGDIIAIEQELNQRESDLESLQAQQRTLARQTAMATVTLTLRTGAVVPPKKAHHDKRGGFLGGLERGWDGFVAAASWCATAFGTLLPFLVLLAVLAAAGRVAWRRMPRRPRPAPAPSE